MPDTEVEAMGRVADALGDLEEGERSRVLRWAAERYGVVIAPTREPVGEPDTGRRSGPVTVVENHEQVDEPAGNRAAASRKFDTFAELYDAAPPSTDQERVLVAGYWTQVVQGKNPFGSRELNKDLRDLGHAVGNINKAMSANMRKKPALILQVSRGGGAPQAQKKYKLSDAGKRWIEARLQ